MTDTGSGDLSGFILTLPRPLELDPDGVVGLFLSDELLELVIRHVGGRDSAESREIIYFALATIALAIAASVWGRRKEGGRKK